MRISTEQLAQHLQRAPGPLYTVFGDEPLLCLEAADRIRVRARTEGYSERLVLTAEQHFDWAQLKQTGQSQSLFATRRIVELRVPSGKPGVDGGQALQDYAARLPADTVTLICLPGVDWRAQKGAWFGALDAAGAMVEAKPVARGALPAWLAGRLQAQQQHADAGTLEYLADRVEGNLLAAYQEVQKMGLLYPPGAITLEQAQTAVTDVSRHDVYALGDVVLAGDAAHLARTLDGLRGEGAAAPLAVWAIAEAIRAFGKVLAAVEAGGNVAQAMRDARIWGPRQALIQPLVKHYSAAQVEHALLHAAHVDRMAKGLARGDVWDEMLQLGLRFAHGTGRQPVSSSPGTGRRERHA